MRTEPAPGILVFDGDCGICQRLAALAVTRACPSSRAVAWQDADLAALGLTAPQCQAAVQWLPADGEPAAGGDAVSGILRAGSGPWRLAGLVLGAPGVRRITRRGYAFVARHRHRLPGSTPSCAVDGGSVSGTVQR